MKVRVLFAALALAMLVAADEARASFTYQVAAVPTTVNFGTGNTSTYTVTPAFGGGVSPVLAGAQNVNLSQMTQTSTRVAPPTDTTSFSLALTVTIKNIESGLSSNIVVTGTIAVTRSDTLGAASTYTLTSILPPSLTLGAFTYALTNPAYTAPTISGTGNAGGGLSIQITETTVPEPSSVALMGIGVAALGGLGVWRHRRPTV